MATQLIQAAQQALEALHEAVAFREGGRQKAIDAINALRTAIQQATQPAEVTGLLEAFDDAVSQELLRVSHVEYDSHEICKHFASKVRAILALRPVQVQVQVPMTDELCWQVWEKAGACDEVNERVTLKVAKPIIRAIVAAYLEVAAHHRITAQAKKETP